MRAFGMGHGIGMDVGSCQDCSTLQDSITDLASRDRSPFTVNHRIFVNLYSNCKAISTRHLREWLAHTNAQAYLLQTDCVCNLKYQFLISISIDSAFFGQFHERRENILKVKLQLLVVDWNLVKCKRKKIVHLTRRFIV